MSKYNFAITLHAKQRFAQRVGPPQAMFEMLNKARHCDEFEKMQIEAEAAEYTKNIRIYKKTDHYFVYNDVVFTCKADSVDSFTVVTVWKKQPPQPIKMTPKELNELSKFIGVGKKKIKPDIDYSKEIEKAKHDIFDYLESDDPFSVKRILEIIHDRPFPAYLRCYLIYLSKGKYGITKTVFIEKIKHLDFYKEYEEYVLSNYTLHSRVTG